MKSRFKTVLLLLIFSSCSSNKSAEVEIVSIAPTPLINMEMSLPGSMYVTDSLVIISKIRPFDELIDVYDLRTLQLKTKLCNIGRASNELIQAELIIDSDSVFVAYDFNGKGIFYSIKDFSIIDTRNDLGFDYDARCKINANSYVVVDDKYDGGDLFVNYMNGEKRTFGKFPIDGDYTNKNEFVKGTLHLTKDSILYYFPYSLPYCAKYKMRENQFELMDEKYYGKYNVSKDVNGRAVFENDGQRLNNLVFTKNYIVNLTRSPEDQLAYRSAGARGNDLSNLPKHLYLYDYDLNLIKIVDLGINTLRIGAERRNLDVVYLICIVDGAFNISKIEL